MVVGRNETNRNRSSTGKPETSTSTESGSISGNQNPWVAGVIALTLEAGVIMMSSYLFMYVYRQLFKPMSPDGTDDIGSNSSRQERIHKRLFNILLKRQSQKENTTSNSNKTSHPIIIKVPALSMYELTMADDIIEPEDIDCSFADVGGLDDTKREIYELAILPLLEPDLFNGKLVQPCKGILLYGSPGTGKTMLAKALAKEAEAIFLPLQLSRILNKFWGESNKLIAATFSLAVKLQPTIIFIDELDTFLKNSSDQTAFMDSIKAEFLTLWDGIGTSSSSRIMVLGATNKPQSIDSAILRRMPRTFLIPLPDQTGRLTILRLLTDSENLEPSCRTDALPRIADMTVGYSGSDLKELCKAAAMVGIRERTAEFARRRVMGENYINSDSTIDKNSDNTGSSNSDPSSNELRQSLAQLRPINENDFLIALEKVKRSGQTAQEYGIATAREEAKTRSSRTARSDDDQGMDADVRSLRQLATLLHTLSSLSLQDRNDDEIPILR